MASSYCSCILFWQLWLFYGLMLDVVLAAPCRAVLAITSRSRRSQKRAASSSPATSPVRPNDKLATRRPPSLTASILTARSKWLRPLCSIPSSHSHSSFNFSRYRPPRLHSIYDIIEQQTDSRQTNRMGLH